ncbi:MAG: RNase adapter RapZ [Oscillospiraceae bacterium]|nr:RNase adapter RapZ [Oscillospiraceae bacterium]
MEFLIVSGMSGAGKTSALHALEDLGFYCVDNIPPQLLFTFYDLCEKSREAAKMRVAVVVDIRAGEVSDKLIEQIQEFTKSSKKFKLLFLDAKPDLLVIRYKETRRKHPLSDAFAGCSTEEAVRLEQELFKPIKKEADFIIDTTSMEIKQLRERVSTIFATGVREGLIITCLSFGFKYGIPLEADLIFDVRCLENPYYVKELKPLTGLDEQVREFVLKFDTTQEFLQRLFSLLDFLMPLYKKEGKSELVIGIGCTGGKHRSVTVARALSSHFIENGEKSAIHHLDIWKA